MSNNHIASHVEKTLDKGMRYDNRKLLDFRKITLETGVSVNAEGSARVTIGDTEVLAGVKLDLGTPYPDIPDQGVMMVGAELLPMSNPKFEPGPPSIHAIELARVVDRGIRESGTIDTKKLCVKEGEKVWMMLLDLIPINDAGNLMDAFGLAALAALNDTTFPKFDSETEKVDYKEKTDKKLELSKLPIPVTVYKIGKNVIVDPLTDEEEAMDARLTVSSTEDGKLCALQKGGDITLSVEDIKKMIEIGIDKGKELRKVFESAK